MERMNQSINQRKNTMIRKTLLGLAAVTALGAAALAPTSASAWGLHGWGHHHGFGGFGFYGPGYVNYVADCYTVKKIYRSGAVRYIRVCN
jgi:predicted oxidoreductase